MPAPVPVQGLVLSLVHVRCFARVEGCQGLAQPAFWDPSAPRRSALSVQRSSFSSNLHPGLVLVQWLLIGPAMEAG